MQASHYVRGLAGLFVAAALLCDQPLACAADARPAGTTADLAAWIDGRVAAHFATTGTPQPQPVDDATFLRRAYLDLLGTIPAVSEVRDFLDDQSDNKRGRLIDGLLADPRCAAHLARTWRRILIPQATGPASMGGALEEWLARQLAGEVAYDELARMLVTAGGAEGQDAQDDVGDADDEVGDEDVQTAPQTPAVAYLQATGGDPASVAGSVSRVFLGVRIECAQCHDHPFTDWTQRDFWGIAAFFAGTRYNRPLPPDQPNAPATDERVTSISPPDVGKTFEAGYLWEASEAAEIPDEKLPRRAFADWLTSPENPHFAATAVNRVWQQLCGHGLTASVDDLDLATAADRAVMLDDLAAQFAAAGFDLKWLIGGVCKSKPYQFAADQSAGDLVAMRPLKVLSPEQVFDSMEVALALPISRIDEGPRYNGQRDQMISRMSEAAGTTPDEFRAGIPQMLMLMNGTVTADATSLDTSRTLRAVVDAPFLDAYEKIETLFLAALTRPPSPSELRQIKDHVDQKSRAGAVGQAYSEIMWALINSPEFMLIR